MFKKVLKPLHLCISRHIPIVQSFNYKTPSGFLILLPEVPENTIEDSIHTESGFPNFNEITPSKLYATVGKLSLDYESSIWSLEEKIKDGSISNSFEDIIESIDRLDSQLSLSWTVLNTLYVVKNNLYSPEFYVKMYDRAMRAKNQKFSSLTIHKACLELSKDDKLNDSQKRIVQKYLLEGKLNGIDFALDQKDHMELLHQKLHRTKEYYRLKSIEALRRFSYTILDSTIVKDFPESLLKNMSFNRTDQMLGPWTVTHQPLVYSEFLKYCPDKDLRLTVWQAFVSRCMHENDSAFTNGVHVEEIRGYRKDMAKLLGFKSFGEMSMKTKMSKSPEQVYIFIDTLTKTAKELQTKEMSSLNEYATENGHLGKLVESDIPYWRRRQLLSLTKFIDLGELNKYFPFEHVWSELLQFASELFSLQFEEEVLDPENKWHSDVRFYRVLDADGKFLSSFYLDPFERPGEKLQSYAGSDTMLNMTANSIPSKTKPSGSLVFSFPQPIDGVSLLSLEDLEQLFLKFGESLQNLLTTFPYREASGKSNIEWDAIEICSNFMLNWLYNPSLLKTISHHHETGESLTADQIEDVLMVRRHLVGYDICQELLIAHFDMEFYAGNTHWMELMDNMWLQYSPFPMYKWHTFPCWFQPTIIGIWAAAYYSHLWSRVIAADAYLAFQEASPEERKNIGKRFRDTFLSVGGGQHSAEVFRDFRNREPVPEYLYAIYNDNEIVDSDQNVNL